MKQHEPQLSADRFICINFIDPPGDDSEPVMTFHRNNGLSPSYVTSRHACRVTSHSTCARLSVTCVIEGRGQPAGVQGERLSYVTGVRSGHVQNRHGNNARAADRWETKRRTRKRKKTPACTGRSVSRGEANSMLTPDGYRHTCSPVT